MTVLYFQELKIWRNRHCGRNNAVVADEVQWPPRPQDLTPTDFFFGFFLPTQRLGSGKISTHVNHAVFSFKHRKKQDRHPKQDDIQTGLIISRKHTKYKWMQNWIKWVFFRCQATFFLIKLSILTIGMDPVYNHQHFRRPSYCQYVFWSTAEKMFIENNSTYIYSVNFGITMKNNYCVLFAFAYPSASYPWLFDNVTILYNKFSSLLRHRNGNAISHRNKHKILYSDYS